MTALRPQPLTSLVPAPPIVTIDRDLAMNLISEAVAQRGSEHVSKECEYSVREERDEPICLIGVIIYNLLGPALFAEWSTYNSGLFHSVASTVEGYEFTSGALSVLNFAQAVQDGNLLPFSMVIDNSTTKVAWGNVEGMTRNFIQYGMIGE